MYYFLAFICGVILGGIGSFFIVQNNQKKAAALGDAVKDKLGKK